MYKRNHNMLYLNNKSFKILTVKKIKRRKKYYIQVHKNKADSALMLKFLCV